MRENISRTFYSSNKFVYCGAHIEGFDAYLIKVKIGTPNGPVGKVFDCLARDPGRSRVCIPVM